jgi:hypothetical protein
MLAAGLFEECLASLLDHVTVKAPGGPSLPRARLEGLHFARKLASLRPSRRSGRCPDPFHDPKPSPTRSLSSAKVAGMWRHRRHIVSIAGEVYITRDFGTTLCRPAAPSPAKIDPSGLI